jgi:hypothetical protein
MSLTLQGSSSYFYGTNSLAPHPYPILMTQTMTFQNLTRSSQYIHLPWPRFMHPATLAASGACIGNASGPYLPGEEKALDMIVSLSTLTQPRMECEASKLPAFGLFFLSSSKTYRTHVLSFDGTRTMTMDQMKTQECGWWSPILTQMALLLQQLSISIAYFTLLT